MGPTDMIFDRGRAAKNHVAQNRAAKNNASLNQAAQNHAAQDIIEAEVEKQAIADAALGNAGHERFQASPAGLMGVMVRGLRAARLVEAWRAYDGSWFYRIDMGIISGRALVGVFAVLTLSALVMIAATLYVVALFGVAAFTR